MKGAFLLTKKNGQIGEVTHRLKLVKFVRLIQGSNQSWGHPWITNIEIHII